MPQHAIDYVHTDGAPVWYACCLNGSEGQVGLSWGKAANFIQ